MSSFLGGIRDERGERAFVPVAAGSIAAVNLVDGRLLWRRSDIGRPVAATIDRLVTLDAEGKYFVLRFIDAVTGASKGRATGFGMPDWAMQTGVSADAVDTWVDEAPTGLRLQWNIRRPYRGGAPPPLQITEQTRDESTGAVMLNPDIAEVRPTPFVPRPEATEAIIPPDLEKDEKAQPDVVAFESMGDRLFALKVRTVSNNSLVSMEAQDAGSGALLWEVPLSQEQTVRPTPQRK